MFKLNKKVKYALIALKHIDRKGAGSLTTTKEICDAYRIPFDTTARALQLMAQKDILQASQGAHGGYHLSKDLNHVSLKDLNDIIVGPVHIARCLDHDQEQCLCAEHCIVITPLVRLNEKILEFLNHISIASLIHGQTHPIENKIRERLLLNIP